MFALKQEPASAGFWGWFVDNQKRLAKMASDLDNLKMDEIEPVLEELALALHDFDERLYAELERDDDGVAVLLITADGEPDGMEAARELVAEAPDCQGWHFEALRQRGEPGETLSLPGGGEIDLREAVFVLEVHKDKAEIAIGLADWEPERADDYTYAASHLVEQMLGENDFNLGVSGVIAVPVSDLMEEADPWPMKALPAEFDRHVEG
jgi:hypothetical protein